MKTIILTDSTSDIEGSILKQLDVNAVPLTVNFGEESFKDGIDLTKKEFFEKLTSGSVNPTTSQPSPEKFLAHFEECKKQGNSLVYIGLSSVLSGTVQSARIAKEMCGYDNIYIVDSLTATAGLELLVRVACQMRDHGADAASIAQEIEKLVPKTRLYAYVDTLKYLVRGGRLSKTAGAIGGALGIKPLITVADGAVLSLGTARGQKNAYEKLCDIVKDANIDTTKPMMLTYTANEENMHMLEMYMHDKGVKYDWLYGEVGSVIGTHVGPGAAAVVYFVK
ncbi:MAG: DegV family protein [Oscillospiraceae bacterium]|nr:DegV family protein [Oscillospiraceae bacterium]